VHTELRAVPLFSDLPDDDLVQLAEGSELVMLDAGEILFHEGDEGRHAYVIAEGEVEIVKITADREVLLARRGVGEVIGEIALLDSAPRMATVRGATSSRLISLEKTQLDRLIESSATAASSMFAILLARWRQTESRLRQTERMAQLGTLTAGLAHELNNPAAAVGRGSAQLESVVAASVEAMAAVLSLDFTAAQQERVDELVDAARVVPEPISSMVLSDNESAIEDLLDRSGIDEPWVLAGQLAGGGYEVTDVATVLDDLGAAGEPVLLAIAATLATHGLVREINEGAGRLSAIVGALKSYSYLDEAPIQQLDVRKGLRDTLLILKSKLGDIDVVTRLEAVPEIGAYGSELNQVWTNLIDNAADAIHSSGRADGAIVLRTLQSGDAVVVEIEDNGEGIPPDVVPRVFDAFFTTKPPGSGTGLGLDISYSIVVHKHRGSITVESEPGCTVFRVALPIVASA
jgi:signal transduction histidine kinase